MRKRLVRRLSESGEDIETTAKGVKKKNSSLFGIANKEQRILITNDTDFLNVDLYPPKGTPGRMILRVFPDTLENQKKSLEIFLSKTTEADLKDKLFIVFAEGLFESKT